MPAGDDLRLLIVEDSADDRDLLVRSLKKAGLAFEWRCAATAREFSDALAETWDAILCDYHLADFDAFGALAMLEQRGLDLPVILVSGMLGEEAAVAAMRAGAHDFFAKGRLTRLPAAIQREIGEAKSRAARRQAEADRAALFADLQRALAARDDFLVLASHELRTPLTVLGLQAEALTRSKARADASVARRLDGIKRQIDWMAALVDRCLDVTRLSSAPLVLSPQTTDLRAVVIDVVERSREWIDQAGCTLTLDPLESAVGLWDPMRLESVVTNLIANALKYGAGKPVEVSTRRAGDRALLSVHDSGIGMSADEQAALFQKFGRAVPKEHYGGLGLGLWVADQITRAHRGQISVESRKGHGATFTVELPLN
jgi:signal transduction histidine kinase